MEQETNSQISRSFGEDEETWDMLEVVSKVFARSVDDYTAALISLFWIGIYDRRARDRDRG